MMPPGNSVLVLWALLFACSFSLWAETEKEPNNFENEATVITGNRVEAQINDEKDWFRVRLPAAGPVTVHLTGIPDDLQVQLGVKGFPHVGWQDGKGDIQYSFDASNADGLVWVQFQWTASVCGSDWCAAQFSVGDNWYGIKPSPGMPAMHDGLRVIPEAPVYSLSIDTPSSPSPGNSSPVNGSATGRDIPESQIIWEAG